MKKTLLILFFFAGLLLQQAWCQQTVMYRLILSDKGNSGFSIDRPEEFLSQKAIERRQKQELAIDESDLPIDPSYFTRLEDLGAKVYTYSKWVGTIVVSVENEGILSAIQNLSFVEDLYPVWEGTLTDEPESTGEGTKPADNILPLYNMFTPEDYGVGRTQIDIINGIALHQLDYMGEGISIAVMDGGFYRADQVAQFDQNRIKETKNFTHEYGNPFDSSLEHGTLVLSCMLANTKGEMIGTAPYADYYLFKTELNSGEYPVEEDYWMAAVEYADNIGIDIISTSLGYATFDNPSMNHSHSQLDGYTVPASRLASMVASKGIILCNSAGNQGNKEWIKMNIPADASDILAVGSVQDNGDRSAFSSYGYSADGRVKPDIMAMGSAAYVAGINGIRTTSGTSAACPQVAGMVACLWQALPELTGLEIMDIVRQSADRYNQPDEFYGYGIPDFYQAYLLGKDETTIPAVKKNTYIWISSGRNEIHINDSYPNINNASLMIYTSMGKRVSTYSPVPSTVDFSNLSPGLYIALLQCNDFRIAEKFIRR